MSGPSVVPEPPPADDPHTGSAHLVAVEEAAMRARRRRKQWRLAVDLAMLALSATVVLVSASGDVTFRDVLVAAGFIAAVVVALLGRGAYEFRLGASPLDEVGRIVTATSTAAMAFIALDVFLFTGGAESGHIARLWAFAAIYVGAGRAGAALSARRARRNDAAGAPTLIVGAGDVGRRLAARLLERPELGLRPIGFLDKEPKADSEAVVPVLGASWDLERVASEHGVAHAIITFSTAPHDVLLELVRRCNRLGIQVSIVPRLFEHLTNRLSVEHIGGIPLLRAGYIDPKGWQFDLKYALDRVTAALILIVLSPLLAVLAIAVKLSSPGPVFHRQVRVGLDDKEFQLLKFRSMRGSAQTHGEHDAAWLASVAGADGATAAEVPALDRRTGVGRFLRRYSLDELPQVINILRGDMSFIGPRPERVSAAALVAGHVYRYGDRHRVKSGLTGWAQVHGLRGQTSLHDRVEWDNYYIENWSAWLDLKILFMTIPAVFGGEGAE